jgi:hypothetical protein
MRLDFVLSGVRLSLLYHSRNKVSSFSGRERKREREKEKEKEKEKESGDVSTGHSTPFEGEVKGSLVSEREKLFFFFFGRGSHHFM